MILWIAIRANAWVTNLWEYAWFIRVWRWWSEIVIHFSKLAAVKNFFTIEMDTTRNKNSGCTGKTSHSKVCCHVELKIVLTLVWNKDCGNQSKMKRATVFCVGYLVYNSTTWFWFCLNLRIILRLQAIICGAENARSQLWVNSLFYGTTIILIVVYGHERHHQCAACWQQLMLRVRVLAWVGYVLVQHPSLDLSSDIPREKGYHNEGLWSSYRPQQGGRETEARPFWRSLFYYPMVGQNLLRVDMVLSRWFEINPYSTDVTAFLLVGWFGPKCTMVD